jgi:phenylpyruvate tautomerase PptA (4-oxalocrotonate tautomerase family)
MPNVFIFNGGSLTQEQAEEMIDRVTHAVCQAKGVDSNGKAVCPPDAVTVSIVDIPLSHIGIGGKSWEKIIND